nr:MAG TPA: hypothetical protein [Caudoviricetes sp.]
MTSLKSGDILKEKFNMLNKERGEKEWDIKYEREEKKKRCRNAN